MMIQIAELKRRANMSSNPIWFKRYQLAIRFSQGDPVNLEWLDSLSPSESEQTTTTLDNPGVLDITSKTKEETWLDRAKKHPLL